MSGTDAKEEGRRGGYPWGKAVTPKNKKEQGGNGYMKKNAGEVPSGRIEMKQCVITTQPDKKDRAVIVADVGVKEVPSVRCEVGRQKMPRTKRFVCDDLYFVIIDKSKTECGEKRDGGKNKDEQQVRYLLFSVRDRAGRI